MVLLRRWRHAARVANAVLLLCLFYYNKHLINEVKSLGIDLKLCRILEPFVSLRRAPSLNYFSATGMREDQVEMLVEINFPNICNASLLQAIVLHNNMLRVSGTKLRWFNVVVRLQTSLTVTICESG